MPRDCNTCLHHVQGRSLYHHPTRCWVCSAQGGMPQWEAASAKPLSVRIEAPLAEDDPLESQVGGSHYKDFPIQPIEFAMMNRLNACQAKVVKYVCRKKGDTAKRLEDLDKAIHVIELYKQLLIAGKAE